MKYISLFCGCGGFDVGLNNAGFVPTAAYDIEPIAVEVFKANINADACIRDLTSGLEKHEIEKGVQLVVAGPPCQGFSTVGKRKLDDPRNNLLTISGEIAVKIKPKVFVVENVRGVTAGEHKQYWEALREMLISSGYKVADLKCDGPDIGLAQLRSRMIMIAWTGKKEINFKLAKKESKALYDVLQGLDSQDNHIKKFLEPDTIAFHIAEKIAPGQKLSDVRGGPTSIHTWDIPEVFGEITATERLVLETILKLRRTMRIRPNGDADPVPVSAIDDVLGVDSSPVLSSLLKSKYIKVRDGNFDLAHGFNGKFRRLCWDKPSYTVDTRFGNPKYFLHPSENRGFTVREAARIQGFPDDFLFLGTESQQFRMVGNAVPPPLGEALGEFIKHTFFV
ncbi:MAG: DNA (cytosine-5-)-methyltransferase [Geobacter sp.]|nr:DNA (cytosine-5-)-methyltransferase [Geobacter sp.]